MLKISANFPQHEKFQVAKFLQREIFQRGSSPKCGQIPPKNQPVQEVRVVQEKIGYFRKIILNVSVSQEKLFICKVRFAMLG